MTDRPTWLLAGLGNPGKQYERTRHNIGFMVADEIAGRLQGSGTLRRFDAEIMERTTSLGRVIMLKPQTFMNLSANAVAPALRWYRVSHDHFLVIYDDLDLPFGRIRLRPSGSSGGHNGVESIVKSLGTDRFPRLRLGIGRSDHSSTVGYVLSRFTRDEEKELKEVVSRAADAALVWHFQGIDAAMNEFNRRAVGDTTDSE